MPLHSPAYRPTRHHLRPTHGADPVRFSACRATIAVCDVVLSSKMSAPEEAPGSDDAALVIVGGGFSLFASTMQIFVGAVMTGVGVAMLFAGTVISVPMALLGIGFVSLGFRTRRLRVVADRTGIVVRNPYRSYRFGWEDVYALDWAASRTARNREFTMGEPGSLLVLTTVAADERVYKLAATFLPGADRYPEQFERLERLHAMKRASSTHDR